ncbi:FAD-binding oxidoreductase [Streptosporangium sandarakinum]|uniref:FAD-binding oxidoreductase n=1 Tax=Streptosporangium sandarakinum TaxID=1260955 RepID=UPI00378D06B1
MDGRREDTPRETAPHGAAPYRTAGRTVPEPGTGPDRAAGTAAREAAAPYGTGVAVREAGPGDAVSGVRPRWVALPESTGEVAALLRHAAAHDLAVVPVGGGTKPHRGLPPERCDLMVGTGRLDGVPEHAAGDLIVRVMAGTTMGTLAAVLAERGQRLCLDVPDGGATVGGTLATAEAGPLRFRYGTARDLLIGVTVVLADGTVARSGGKVVKNVAGYDLGKLFTGSHGTLGVITEAVFRLNPVPPVRRWVVAEPPASDWPSDPSGDALDALAGLLAASPAEPSAIEADLPGPGREPSLAVLVEGTAAEERARAVRDLLDGHCPARVTDEAPAWWGVPPGEETLLELRFPPGRAGGALRAVAAGVLPARVRGSVASGVLRAGLPSGVAPPEFAGFVTSVRDGLAGLGGRLTVVAAPPALMTAVDPWGPVSALPLMRRVRERLDPDRRMSPGRLPGGM